MIEKKVSNCPLNNLFSFRQMDHRGEFLYGYVPEFSIKILKTGRSAVEFRHAEKFKKPCLTSGVRDSTVRTRMLDDAH